MNFIFAFLPSAAILDIGLTFKAWGSFEFTQILRYLMKLFMGAIWVVILPIGYSISEQNPTGVIKFFKHWTGNMQNRSFYNYLVVLYLIPDLLATILFVLPLLRKKMELSNWWIITLVMWWNQASISSIITFGCSFFVFGLLFCFYASSSSIVIFLLKFFF